MYFKNIKKKIFFLNHESTPELKFLEMIWDFKIEYKHYWRGLIKMLRPHWLRDNGGIEYIWKGKADQL